MSLLLSAAHAADLTSGLAIHYLLDGSAADASGNGNHATVYGATFVADREGTANAALSFNGTPEQYVLANSTIPNFPSTAITVAFWMKTTDNGDRYWISYAAPQDDNWVVAGVPGALAFKVSNPGRVDSSITANDGLWHHIAWTWQSSDGATALYRDGFLVASGAMATGISIENNGYFVLGQDQDFLGYGFDPAQSYIGALDDVRIYNRVLSTAEVALLAATDTDADNDGIPDDVDVCPNTSAGAIVDGSGCSIEQIVPCRGPASGGSWKNHGQFVSGVAKVAQAFHEAGLISEAQKDAIIAAAAESACGKK